MDASMRFARPAIGHEDGDDLPIRLPDESHILQAHLSAVQARVPARIIKAGHMPAPLESVVKYECLAQELAHTPEIVFGLVAANNWLHGAPFCWIIPSYQARISSSIAA